MKKLLWLTLLCCFMLIPAVAFGSPVQQDTVAYQTDMQQVVDKDSIAGMSDPDVIPLGRGCCSWHKGVCGCHNGRTACCDGTLSPSCRC